MTDLINRLVEQFRSKSQYDHFVRQSQEKFDINTYRFQQLTQAMARKGYNQLKEKYEHNIFQQGPRSWHENQRKLFVWFLLAFIKILKQSHKKMEQEHWQELSETFFNKDILFLKYQFNAIQKNRKRHQWTQQEDQILKSSQQFIQSNNWNQIAKEIFFKTQGKSFKSSKQCRQRWQNHLDNRIKKQQWQNHQDLTILKFVVQNGKKWSKIVQELKNTRTQHMVKNRFKSLMAKAQNDFKNQKRKLQKENMLIEHLIEQINSKNSFIEKKSSLQNGSQAKDIVQQQDFQDLKLNFHKKSHMIHGVLQRNENGQFLNQSLSTRSSPAPNIFESQSPATLSLGSGGFLYAHSLWTPQSSTPNPTPTSDAFGMNSSFGNCQKKWTNFYNKGSITSQTSNATDRLINCCRKEDNLKFSHQFKTLQNGQKVEIESGGLMPNSCIQKLHQKLFPQGGNNDNMMNNDVNSTMQNSEYYMKTLESSFAPTKQQQQQYLSKSAIYENKDIRK